MDNGFFANMPFDHEPLEIISIKETGVRQQQISRNPTWNRTMNLFAYTVEQYLIGVDSEVRVEEITYKSPVNHKFSKNGTSRAWHYKASDEATVIVLPQRGSGYNFAQLVCCYLASNGIGAYELEAPLRRDNLPDGIESVCDIEYDLPALKEVFRKAVTEARGMADIAAEDKIGILGISLGAIFSSVVYGIDDGFASACLVMGGGDFPSLLKHSRDKFVRHLYSCLGDLSDEDVSDIEPCNFVSPAKSGKLLMVNATHDNSIPANSRTSLWEAWGRPEQYMLGDSHFSIIRRVPGLLPRILEHYERTLK